MLLSYVILKLRCGAVRDGKYIQLFVFFGVSVPTAKGPYSESELNSISQTILT